MQPLSNFQFPTGHCEFGRFETMISHPQIAVRVAACISEWAEIETTLGVLLAILLNASPKAALAMYGSTENRTTQIKMVMAAAVHQLSQDESDLTY